MQIELILRVLWLFYSYYHSRGDEDEGEDDQTRNEHGMDNQESAGVNNDVCWILSCLCRADAEYERG